ncbi:filamentous hemagglutinin N-terminal domain-containing protein [Campylobacter jejuni]|nr:filamentous hemagglutinin N-terminal domain-containing protein [Campylobacter jejuni]EAB5426677.1 filamentous hemagglutinin N-terminal domain-containing protein [Campylobacter jejuni]EAH4513860.1 filamentous hemagglutinin N-terminal domain-containing protein [Campylobacter jejuni]EAH4560066.1 filamentous hemagglutinin N-terminal domain-containing protein [Campylobacter jejuni]EAH4649962.1 filamentous hemagglutinin N-terminal domain-containing protein [Campylobacter jejuni]
MKKMSKHIVLSFAVSSLLFSQAYALPQGGKFTHGTTGSISSSNGTMNITGNKGAGSNGNNFVIQWGGGFNIGQNESVNFNDKNQNYLNIAYQKDASKIDGALNGGNNNIFLVNPMGVLIGKTGTITAGKFVASTTPLNDENVKTFLKQGASFSPAFDVSKQGNIVNLGAINAQDIVLVGNRVEINKGDVTSQNLELIGNKVYVDAGVVKNTDSVVANVEKEAIIQQSITSFEKDGALLGSSNSKFSFDNSSSIKNWTKYGSIADATEWNKFANFWNSDKNSFRSSFNHFRLIDDVDFKGMQTNIVGDDINNAFTKSFDGSGYALKNVNINSSNQYVGIFGVVQDSYIRNLNIQGLAITSNFNGAYVGGIVGQNIANYVTGFENVTVNDLVINAAEGAKVGGIIGWGNGSGKTINFTNVAINDISIVAKEGSYVGGVGGLIDGGNFNNVVVNDIVKLYTIGFDSRAGGLAGKVGNSKINNAYLFYKNGASLSAGSYNTQAGKVVGDAAVGDSTFNGVYVYHNLENGYVDDSQAIFTSKKYTDEATGKKDFDNAIRKQFSDIKYLDNNSYAFADSFAKVTDAVKLSKDDFDPKLLQRILDDLMNGKYTYDFDTKTWTYTDSKGVVGENEASEITQSLNFLNAFKDTKMEQEFVNLWKNSQDQNYKNYTNLYEKWTQKKTAMDKIKTGEGYFASFKEELQKYQEALAQLDKENKNYEKIKESGLVSDETLRAIYEKLLEQKEALEKQFADLSGNEGFHHKLENEILNSQGFAINGSDVDGEKYTGNFNFKGKLASLPEKPNISIYEPDKQGGEDPDKPSVLPPEIPEKVIEAPIKIQTEVDTKKEEDDDQVEIGEADARSSGLRCIVSDNFKTMNICVNAK